MFENNSIADLIIKLAEKSVAPQINIIKASVSSSPPELKIKFAEIEIPSEQIYCSNYLLPHYHRTYTFKGNIDKQHQDINGYSMTFNGLGPHDHTLQTIDSTGNYKHSGDLWLEDTLKVGDEVLVVVLGVFYVVVTKITKMPSGAIEGV